MCTHADRSEGGARGRNCVEGEWEEENIRETDRALSRPAGKLSMGLSTPT